MINYRYNGQQILNDKTIVQPIKFESDSPFYHKEEWREISNRYIKDIQKGYYISTYGRIYSIIKSPNHPNGGFISPSINAKGYLQVGLKNIYGYRMCLKVHRLVMICFAYIPGCENFEVDHLDSITYHNWLWNLEWVSVNENNRRMKYNLFHGETYYHIIDAESLAKRYDVSENNLNTLLFNRTKIKRK